MRELIDSVRQSLQSNNYYSALFVSISIPAICASLEYGKSHNKEYALWFDKNLPTYKDYLSGNDCYALRCALLHEGSDDTSQHRAKEVIEKYAFTVSGPHRFKFTGCVFNGISVPPSLILNVEIFCNDILQAAEDWLEKSIAIKDFNKKLESSLKIYPPGSTYFNNFISF